MLVLAFATHHELTAALPGTPGGQAPGDTLRVSPGGREALALVTGVGPVGAALRLGKLLGGRTVSGVVNLGVAGSYDPVALPIGTPVVADLEIWPEYGLRTVEGVDAGGFKFPLARTSHGPVRDRVRLSPDDDADALGLTLDPAWPHAAALTVAGVTADAHGAQTMRERYAPGLENMEGFALALACLEAGIPFLEVRTVSNTVGSRDGRQWDLPGALDTLPGVVDVLFGAGR